MTHVHVHGGGAEAPRGKDTPAVTLVATLAIAGALAGLLVASVYQVTLPTISRHRATVMQAAIGEVLKNPARWDTLYLQSGALTTSPTGERGELERVFLGYDADGKVIGAAISAGEPGFTEVISLMFGYDPATRQLIGLKILDEKETPGLGDKIEKDSGFTRQFAGVTAPVKPVKKRSGSDPAEIDAISGATISSRAVTRIINHAVEKWGPLLAARAQGARP
ncbi:MAG: FMN-binding protein [Gemmatimonadetes bacterium]|nr:FMN-binding protein [Gemmatimonadota bacterium]